MALDRTFQLRRVVSGRAFQRAGPAPSDLSENGDWSFLQADAIPALAAVGWTDIALLVPGVSRVRLVRALVALADDRHRGLNVYDILENEGVLVVSPLRWRDGGLVLSGGSYSTVSLHLQAGRPVVRKDVTVYNPDDPDRERRQRQECAWMKRLAPEVAHLFPRVLSTHESPGAFELTTEFSPGYSLAELVFQGRANGSEVAEILRSVYIQIAGRMWTLPPVDLGVPADEHDYIGRIRRRCRAITVHSVGGPLERLLRATRVTVNGRECLGVPQLLRDLESDSRWRPVVAPEGRALCHGDLILEDIIVDTESPAGFRLVDPNPNNQHPIYDLSKTLMSLWLGYEFFYFDLFGLSAFSATGDLVQVDLELSDDEAQSVYASAAGRFIPFVMTEMQGHLGLPERNGLSLLRMGAAINMLAIPMFHLLHHAHEARAVAFAATALWHAEEARSQWQ
jgi:hypothetical protein